MMICTVLVFLSGVLAVGEVKLYAKNNAYKAQEEELAAQIKEEEKRSEEVNEYEKYVQTDEYIKETA
ncbi:septum formation initiator family protein, partial [[Ruminococcus] torques]|nr:septum formation initiator family protein [[Ruminococcus] torques]